MELNFIIKKLKYFFKLIIIFNFVFIIIFNSIEIFKKNKKFTLTNHNKILINNSIIVKRDNFGFKPIIKKDENGIIPDFTWNYCWNYINCYFNENDVDIQKVIIWLQESNYFKLIKILVFLKYS